MKDSKIYALAISIVIIAIVIKTYERIKLSREVIIEDVNQISKIEVLDDKNEYKDENALTIELENNNLEENIVVEEIAEKKYNEGITGSNPYYIVVNKQENVVTIYTKDQEGYYTEPFKAMICSTGIYTPQCSKYPKETYKTTGSKNRWNYLQRNVYGQYATQIVGNILFHSVPYKRRDVSTLEYWEYDLLGTKASVGCIRLTVEDAKWIYDNISAGTMVRFCEEDDVGPLGKPEAKKISDNEECRNWDPTDDHEGNPWKTK